MENLQVGVVFRGGDTTTECSDVHIRMIHLRQANKRETDLLSFRQLQSEDLFTDMTLVLKVILALFWENHRNKDQLHTLRIMSYSYTALTFYVYLSRSIYKRMTLLFIEHGYVGRIQLEPFLLGTFIPWASADFFPGGAKTYYLP